MKITITLEDIKDNTEVRYSTEIDPPITEQDVLNGTIDSGAYDAAIFVAKTVLIHLAAVTK